MHGAALLCGALLAAAHASDAASLRPRHAQDALSGTRIRRSMTNVKTVEPKGELSTKLTLTNAAPGAKNVVICMDAALSLCLDNSGSEFVSPVTQWDVLAVFEQDAEGKLKRTEDSKCIQAKAMDGATWFDLAYVDCAQGSKWAYKGGRLRTQEAGKEVCMYQDEGYAVLDLCSKPVAASPAGPGGPQPAISVAAASTQVSDKPIKQKIQDTMDSVYKGSFWEYAWDLHVGKTLADADVKKEIDMSQMNGAERPLASGVLECRGTCDATAWCTGFDFLATDKTCRLTGTKNPKLTDRDDALALIQNDKYNHSDFFLSPSNRRQAAAPMAARPLE